MKDVFIHHVFFWLKDKDSAVSMAKLHEGLLELSKVKTIKDFHIGIPAGTHREVIENSYSLSWLVIFNNGADQASYQVDPIHLHFVAECAKLWDRVQVFDSIDQA